MKIITLEQINLILAVVGEFPAKNVIQVIDILRNLPDSEPKKDIENVNNN